MSAFGTVLRQLRVDRQLSLRALSAQVNYDYGYLGQVERGVRKPTTTLAEACDRALDASGTLLAAHERQAGEAELQRRTVLRALGALAVNAPPMIELETLRHSVGQAIGGDHDDWQQIVVDYGYSYYRTAPDVLMRQVTSDLAVLQAIIAGDTGARRASLSRVASQLSVLVAMTLVATGDLHLARRWWSTARRGADESGDVDTQVLVRAWEVVNGCYGFRPLAQVIALSEEAVALAGTRCSAAAAGLWAGRAQSLALLGRRTEAIAAVQQVASITDRLPGSVTNELESLWGWPEHRLRHTESYVYTHVGDLPRAQAAQERAMALYPPSQARLRTQVQLHRASCLIQGGEIADGLGYAAGLLDELPAAQHNTLLHEVARHVLAAVPTGERTRAAAVELEARIPDPTRA